MHSTNNLSRCSVGEDFKVEITATDGDMGHVPVVWLVKQLPDKLEAETS